MALQNAAADEQPPRKAGEVYPEAAVGLLKEAELRNLPDGVVARLDEKEFTKDLLYDTIAAAPEKDRQLFEDSQSTILSQLIQREMLLNAALQEGFLEEDADKETEQKAIMQLVEKNIGQPEVTEEELRQTYEQLRPQIGNQKYEAVKQQLHALVVQQKQMEIFSNYMKQLTDNAEIVVNEQWLALENERIVDNPLDKARKNGRVTVADFGSEWCPPCKRMAPIIEQIEREQKDLNVVEIDVDKERVLSMRFGVQNLPTFIFFDAAGNEVARVEGAIPKERFEQYIRAARKNSGNPGTN